VHIGTNNVTASAIHCINSRTIVNANGNAVHYTLSGPHSQTSDIPGLRSSDLNLESSHAESSRLNNSKFRLFYSLLYKHKKFWYCHIMVLIV